MFQTNIRCIKHRINTSINQIGMRLSQAKELPGRVDLYQITWRRPYAWSMRKRQLQMLHGVGQPCGKEWFCQNVNLKVAADEKKRKSYFNCCDTPKTAFWHVNCLSEFNSGSKGLTQLVRYLWTLILGRLGSLWENFVYRVVYEPEAIFRWVCSQTGTNEIQLNSKQRGNALGLPVIQS